MVSIGIIGRTAKFSSKPALSILVWEMYRLELGKNLGVAGSAHHCYEKDTFPQ